MRAKHCGSQPIITVVMMMALCTASTASMAAQSDLKSAQITILYDAFGKQSAMTKDWGYSAFIEYQGERILFDTGNNPKILAKNAKEKQIDLSRLDFAVLSHRHSDHMGGMEYLLRVNPKVKVYAPKEAFGIYGSSLPSTFYRRDESLPEDHRYYEGSPPQTMKFGSAWPHAQFELVEKTTEVAPGIHLIALVSDKPGTLELLELSLAVETQEGLVLVVGCSHPGIERIVDAASAIDRDIHLIAGGLHLVTAKDGDIENVGKSLHQTWNVAHIAPGHCTGEPTFSAFQRIFGDRYLYAGVGERLNIGPPPD